MNFCAHGGDFKGWGEKKRVEERMKMKKKKKKKNEKKNGRKVSFHT